LKQLPYQRGTYPINKGAIPSKEGIIPLMVDLINYLLSTINTGIGPEGGEVKKLYISMGKHCRN